MAARIYRDLPDVQSDLGGLFPWTSKRVDIGGGLEQAYVDEGPKGGTTFVLLHGNPTWGFLYRRFIERLSKHSRVIVPDHLGFGRSDKSPREGDYTLQRHIDGLGRVLDAAEADRVILGVQDWGGPIGCGWAVAHPERVAGLLIMNTWAFLDDPVMKLPWLFKFLVRGPSGWRRVVNGNFFTETILGKMGTVRKLSPAEIDAYRAPHPRPEDRVGIARFPRLIPETHDLEHESRATMDEIEKGLARLVDKPTLICWALKDVAFRKPHLERWTRLFRDVDGPHLYRNASHYLQEDVPEEILDHLERWMAEQRDRL